MYIFMTQWSDGSYVQCGCTFSHLLHIGVIHYITSCRCLSSSDINLKNAHIQTCLRDQAIVWKCVFPSSVPQFTWGEIRDCCGGIFAEICLCPNIFGSSCWSNCRCLVLRHSLNCVSNMLNFWFTKILTTVSYPTLCRFSPTANKPWDN